MTDPAKEYLESVYEARAEIDRLHRSAQSMYDAVTHITRSTDGIRVNESSDNGKLLAVYADTVNVWRQRLVTCLQLEREVQEFIDRCPGGPRGIYRILLRLRYLDCLSWNHIQERLQKETGQPVFYSDRHLFRLHGEALSAARRQWAEEHSEER